MFTVYNRDHEKIENVRISINGTDITMGQEVFLYEEDCRQAKVKIIAPDYETFEQKVNLLNECCEVTLSRKVKSYRATVELANGRPAEMTLESKYLSSKYDSPLKGYDYDEAPPGNKILRMSLWFIWKQRLWGFFAALAAVMLIIAYAAFDTWIDSHHFKFGLPPWEEDKPYVQQEQTESEDLANQPESTIVDYLNNNTQWSKDVLEKDPITQGIYDKINEYRFSELVNINIDGCESIAKIKELAHDMSVNNFSMAGKYSQDGTITIQKWVDKVKSKIDELHGHGDFDDFGDSQEELAKKKAAEDAKKKTAEDAKKKTTEDAKKKTTEDAAKKKVEDTKKKNKNNDNNPYGL